MNHTPTPWTIEQSPHDAKILWICGPTGVRVAMCSMGGSAPSTDTIRDANAAFIVRACNSHTALVNASTNILRLADKHYWHHPEVAALRHALKLVAAGE